jgi:hypothetical protein
MQARLHCAGILSFKTMRAVTQVTIMIAFQAEYRCSLAVLVVYVAMETLWDDPRRRQNCWYYAGIVLDLCLTFDLFFCRVYMCIFCKF